MSVKDVIKKGILESFTSGNALTVRDICIIGLIACIIGIYLFVVYKNFSRKSFYSKDFNIALAGMCIVVAAIMIAMQSNLIVSLGMVGALSIVRFRTAVKSPLDLLYLFWSISAGIICGVGLYGLAIALCAIMTILIFILDHLPEGKSPTVLIVRSDKSVQGNIIDTELRKHCRYYRSSSVNISGDEKESLFEIVTTEKGKIVDAINGIDGVHYVSCLDSDGEMR